MKSESNNDFDEETTVGLVLITDVDDFVEYLLVLDSLLGTSVTVQVRVDTVLLSELFFLDFFFPCLHFSQLDNKLSLLVREVTLDPLPLRVFVDEDDDFKFDWVNEALDSTPENELSTGDDTDNFEPLFLLCLVVSPLEDSSCFGASEHEDCPVSTKELELLDTNDETESDLLLAERSLCEDECFSIILLSL